MISLPRPFSILLKVNRLHFETSIYKWSLLRLANLFVCKMSMFADPVGSKLMHPSLSWFLNPSVPLELLLRCQLGVNHLKHNTWPHTGSLLTLWPADWGQTGAYVWFLALFCRNDWWLFLRHGVGFPQLHRATQWSWIHGKTSLNILRCACTNMEMSADCRIEGQGLSMYLVCFYCDLRLNRQA